MRDFLFLMLRLISSAGGVAGVLLVMSRASATAFTLMFGSLFLWFFVDWVERKTHAKEKSKDTSEIIEVKAAPAPQTAEEIDCCKLAQEVLNNFQTDSPIEMDMYLGRARLALVNAIVFYFCFDHDPADWEFVRVMNLLEKAKFEAESGWLDLSLEWMFAKEGSADKPTHFGQRELKVFFCVSPQARPMIICDILQNFKTPAGCKQMLATAKQKMTEPREHIVTYREYYFELERMKARLDREAQSCVPNIHNVIQFVNRGPYDNVLMDVNVYNTGDVSGTTFRCLHHCIEVAVEMAENFKYNGYCIVRSHDHQCDCRLRE